MYQRRYNLSDSVTPFIDKTPIPPEVSTTIEIPDEMASSGYSSPPQQESCTEGEWVDGDFVKSAGNTSGSIVTDDGNTPSKATQVLRVLNEGADASVTGSGIGPTLEEHPPGSGNERSVWSPDLDTASDPGAAWKDKNGRPLVLEFEEDFECKTCPDGKCGTIRSKYISDYSESKPCVPEDEDWELPPKASVETSKAITKEGVAAGSAQDYVGRGNTVVYNPYKHPPTRYGLFDYVRKYLETYKPKFTVAGGKVLTKIMNSDDVTDESAVLENDDWQEPPNYANATLKVNSEELVRVTPSDKNRKLRQARKPMQPFQDLNAKSPSGTKSPTAPGRPMIALVTRDSKAHRILQILNEGVDNTEFFELLPIECGTNQRNAAVEEL